MMVVGTILTATRPKWAAKSSELVYEQIQPTKPKQRHNKKMINILWVVGVVGSGFLFGKLMHGFMGYMIQAIKNSEENR